MKQQSAYVRGFVALLSVIIISTVLLGLVATANTAAFLSRFAELDTEYKYTSSALAKACVNVALRNLAQNYNYITTNEEIFVGQDSCHIVEVRVVSTTATQKTVIVQTSASYKETFTNLLVTAQVQNPSLEGDGIVPAIVVVSGREVP